MDVLEAEVRTYTAELQPAVDPDLVDLSWPRDQLGKAVEALARLSGLCDAAGGGAAMPTIPPIEASAQTGNWLAWAAGRLGVEAEPVEFPLPEFERGLMKACPMVHALHDGRELRFLLLLKARGRTIALVGPDLRLHWRPVDVIRTAATARTEAPLKRDLDRLLEAANVAPGRRDEVRSAMLRQRLAGQMVGGCWILRLSATAPFFTQLTRAGLIRRLGLIITLFISVYLVEIIGWALIGTASLDGRLDLAWLVAWLLLLVSNIPLRIGTAWLDATFALDLGPYPQEASAGRRAAHGFRRDQATGCRADSRTCHGIAGTRIAGAERRNDRRLRGLELMFSAWILTTGAAGYWHLLALPIWLAATCGLLLAILPPTTCLDRGASEHDA